MGWSERYAELQFLGSPTPEPGAVARLNGPCYSMLLDQVFRPSPNGMHLYSRSQCGPVFRGADFDRSHVLHLCTRQQFTDPSPYFGLLCLTFQISMDMHLFLAIAILLHPLIRISVQTLLCRKRTVRKSEKTRKSLLAEPDGGVWERNSVFEHIKQGSRQNADTNTLICLQPPSHLSNLLVDTREVEQVARENRLEQNQQQKCSKAEVVDEHCNCHGNNGHSIGNINGDGDVFTGSNNRERSHLELASRSWSQAESYSSPQFPVTA